MLYIRNKIFLIAFCITWVHVFWIVPIGAQSLAFYKTEKVIVNQPWIKHIPSASKPQILQPPSLGSAEIEEVGEEYFLRYDNKGIAEYDTVVLQTEGDIYADRKSTRLNSSHVAISYAVFCLKKKKKKISNRRLM